MGQYTEHWAKYKRDANRRTLQLLGFLLFLPAIAVLGYLLSEITDLVFPVVVTLLVVWLVVFTRLALRSSKVPCPRCSSTYSRGKYLVPCPKCGLPMFQEE
jgi:cobalamin biosynthesis protein CobD/CbiB